MASFKIAVGVKRADGTHNVKIRITAGASNTLVSTSMYVSSKQVTRAGVIKDQSVVDACEDIIRGWRAIIVDLGAGVSSFDAKALAKLLKDSGRERRGFKLDFVAHIRDVAKTKRSAHTAHNYNVVASSLERYIEHRGLDINDVSAQLLANYEEWLRSEGIAPGTITQYMTLIRSAHNAARMRYNDEDIDIVRVRRSPFGRYKVPPAPAPKARGVDLDTLQAIADLPDEARVNSSRNLARDVFMLSFGLGGMNYVDIYNLPYSAYNGDYIEYNRTKTKGARADGALYRVKVLDEVKPLIKRYLDPTRARLFRFHATHSQYSFAMTLSRAMGYINKEVPYERPYTFYAARHTYASLARNIVGLDKYTVHELLNHSDNEMKITDRYIERDWQRLFEAHAKVVRLVDWMAICSS